MVALCLKGWEKFKDTKSIDHAKFYGEELFAAYVRKNDLEEQKKLAFLLSQKYKDVKYRQWGVVSQAFLARKSDPAKAAMATTLANRMFEKHLEESEAPTAQEVLFYSQLLLDQGELSKAIALLEGPIARNAFKIERHLQEKIAELKVKDGKWEEVRRIFKTLLEKELVNEDWKWYIGLFDSTFKIISSDPSRKSDLLTDVEAVLKSCRDNAQQTIKRGVALAEMEFEKLQIAADPSRSLDVIFGQAVQFFRENGTKPSAYRDLRPYLITLNGKNYTSKFVEAISPLVDSEFKDPLSNCQARITLEKVKKACAHDLQTKAAQDIAASLLVLYAGSVSLKKIAKLEATDRGHGDDFLLLAVHYLLDDWTKGAEDGKGNDSILLDSIIALERGLRDSPYNFAFKLLLIRLYCYFGAIQKACEIFFSLDIKHIQFDTMAHFVSDDAVKYFALNDLAKIFKDTSKLHTDEIDLRVPVRITDAYRNGAFTMINEFSLFLDRLQHSAQWAAAKVESIHTTLFNKCSSVDDVQKFLEIANLDVKSGVTTAEEAARLTHNYDWKVVDRFDLIPTPDIAGFVWHQLFPSHHSSAYFAQERGQVQGRQKLMLRLRNLELRSLSEIIKDNSISADTSKMLEEVLGALNFGGLEGASHQQYLSMANLLSALTDINTAYKDSTTAEAVNPAHSALEAAIGAAKQLVQSVSSIPSSAVPNADIPMLRQVLEAFLPLLIGFHYGVGLFPKRFNKKADDSLKDLYKIDKKAMVDLLALVKSVVGQVQSLVESAASAPINLNFDFASSASQAFLSKDECAVWIDQIKSSVSTSRKVALQRLLEVVKDRNRILQAIKL